MREQNMVDEDFQVILANHPSFNNGNNTNSALSFSQTHKSQIVTGNNSGNHAPVKKPYPSVGNQHRTPELILTSDLVPGTGMGSTSASSSIVNPFEPSPSSHNQQAGELTVEPRTGRQRSQSECEAGKILVNYEIFETIGQGGFAKVKIGIHKITRQKVAIKIVNKLHIKKPAELERLRREMATLKMVRHPNICQLYELQETASKVYIVLEHAPRGELFEYIVARQKLKEEEARKFFRQIAVAVAYCHSKKIIHRDLKPENLLLDQNNNVKLIDFGLVSRPEEVDSLISTSCGSPAYAAPELILGKDYKGDKADMWSLGVLLFALLCGYLPFDNDDIFALYKLIEKADYTIPIWVSRGSASFLKRMLEVDPEKRISTEELLKHPWLHIGYEAAPPLTHVSPTENKPVNIKILEAIGRHFSMPMAKVREAMEEEQNDVTITYAILETSMRKNLQKINLLNKIEEEKEEEVEEAEEFGSRIPPGNNNRTTVSGPSTFLSNMLSNNHDHNQNNIPASNLHHHLSLNVRPQSMTKIDEQSEEKDQQGQDQKHQQKVTGIKKRMESPNFGRKRPVSVPLSTDVNTWFNKTNKVSANPNPHKANSHEMFTSPASAELFDTSEIEAELEQELELEPYMIATRSASTPNYLQIHPPMSGGSGVFETSQDERDCTLQRTRTVGNDSSAAAKKKRKKFKLGNFAESLRKSLSLSDPSIREEKPEPVPGHFSVNTTSIRDADDVLEALKKSLTKNNITFKSKSKYILQCEKTYMAGTETAMDKSYEILKKKTGMFAEEVNMPKKERLIFKMQICSVLDDLIGVCPNRIKGDVWKYKETAQKVISDAGL